MSRLSKAEKQIIALFLKKHQTRHPGCALNEKLCASKLSKKCIGRGDATVFHGRMCDECRTVYNQNYHTQRVGIDTPRPRGRPAGVKKTVTKKKTIKKKSSTSKKGGQV